MTDHCTTESVVNLVHRAIQGVELSTSLATFLEFTLETAEDVVKGKTTLAGWTHAAHTDESMRLHRRAALASSTGSLTVEIERITGTGGRGHVLVVAREGVTGRVLDDLLLLRMGRSLGFLLIEDTEDTGGDLVVDDGLVIFADNVNAKLLINCRRFV